MSSGQFWIKVCLQAVRSKRGVAAASAFTSVLVQDPEPRNPGTPPGRQSGHPDARGRHELHAARGSAGAAALGGRRAPGTAGRKAEVSGLSSHASTSAGKRPATCPDLGDSRLASRETPGSPRRGRRSTSGQGSGGREAPPAGAETTRVSLAAPRSSRRQLLPGTRANFPSRFPAAQGRGNRGRQLRVGQGCSVEALTPAGPGPATPGRVAIAAGLLRSLWPGPLPGSRAGREQQPGAPRPRARRGQGRRSGFERTAAGSAPTLSARVRSWTFRVSARANEEDSHGNSTTYLWARNGRASLSAPHTPAGPAAAQKRQTARRGRAIGLPGCTPRAPCAARPGTLPGRRTPQTAPHTAGTRIEGVCLCLPLCLPIFLTS